MDPKLAAILKKAKAIDSATAQKNGETRRPTQRQTPVNRDYFDEPEVEYLQEGQVPTQSIPSSGGGGGLFDQMGVSSGGSGPTSVPLAERMDVNSDAYTSSVESSNLPPAIMKAMLDTPIPMGDGLGGTSVSEEFIKEINPNMGRTQVPELPQIQEQQFDSYNEEDEGDYYSHPIQETQVKPREIPNTQRRPVVEHTEVGTSEIRTMIAQEIAKALPKVIEQYFDKRVLKENVSFKAGNTTFSGTVSPLPKKRTKKRKQN
jgi:hypothetical protein